MSLLPDSISIRDQMVATAAGTLHFIDVVKSLGVGAIELQVDPDLTTPHVRQIDGEAFCLGTHAGIVKLNDLLRKNRIRVSAVLLMTDFSSEKPAEQIAWTVRAIHIAAQLGAPAVRIDPLTQNKALARETVCENFTGAIKEVLAETAGSPVDLGIENHGTFGNSPLFLDAIFAAIDDPRLGMTLDIGNFYWWGVPLEEVYSLLAWYVPLVKHTHIKNINYPPDLAKTRRPVGLDYGKYCCPLDEGNIDLRRAIRILGDANYPGDLCIENEMVAKRPAEQRMDVLRRDVEALRRAIS